MTNHVLDQYLEELAEEQLKIQNALQRMNPQVQLTPVTDVSILTFGGPVAHVHFESRGARVISEKTVINWSMATGVPILVSFDTDPIVYGNINNIGWGLMINGSPYTTSFPSPSTLTIPVPIKQVSFAMSASGVNHNVGINLNHPIGANDSGYITVYGWGTEGEALHPRGNR